MTAVLNRRLFIASTAGFAAATLLRKGLAEEVSQNGLVAGQPQAAAAGIAMLASGGNAVDAVVTAALVAGVVAVNQTGIGGYGGHLVLAGLPGGKVTAIDFNSTAPAAMRPDTFVTDRSGHVKNSLNQYGWLSAGVPGVLAGLELALTRYGTKRFAEVVQPAIGFAREGFPVSKGLAGALAAARNRLVADAGSTKLFFTGGQPLAEGATFRNPDLAKMLETLAERGSVRSFYEGDIADRIAAAFKKYGGLVTAADLAAYKAVELAPLSLDYGGRTIHTPPPTAGGLTVLQAIAALQAAHWSGMDETGAAIFAETLRVAWMDRLQFLGDPLPGDVPVKKLLSVEYARETADRVLAAVREKKPIVGTTDGRPAGGTIHLCAVDSAGLTAALTFTHGESLGAQITVDGLGLVLGHGMSRFDPRPGRANSPGPGKRPLHNMCPTVVTQDGQTVLALGATGGRRIVSAVANVLARQFGERMSLEDAVKAPRLHTEGTLALSAEERFPVEGLKPMGYAVTAGRVATVTAIERNCATGELAAAAR